jgi:SAM-dependent methyltransferase
MRRLVFDLSYRFGAAPWDSGIAPPELVAFVETERARPGRAIDLGCGTGTSVIYLARHGWQGVGVDYSRAAIAAAHRRASGDDAKARTRFLVADATDLPDLGLPFDLALDVGCLQSIPTGRRPPYAEGLAARLRPGATFLLHAFLPAPGRPGIAQREVESLFSEFALVRVEPGLGRPSARYRFQRR